MSPNHSSPLCPACGTRLTDAAWAEGVCPDCKTELSSSDSAAADLPTMTLPAEILSAGQILGDRYRVRSTLGRGGMGEVWRATDLKLRVDVALKSLRAELMDHERALETLRQEVRVAREVVSPNVCRVFDLVELDGHELVSMEYIDGTTLGKILAERSPLELQEAREIAAQFLAGLQAIHQAGLVHRDIKPENIMVTRSGRVVVMDLGIAKGLAAVRTGTVSGTLAYMAPEQQRGEAVDARADVFSAGLVLAEMTAPEGARDREARLALWQGAREVPPRLPDSPWRAVLEKAVAGEPDARHASAAELARALEEVTLRVEGAEDLEPYPGLAAFTEANAEYFFGRELDVEAMWKKLRRPNLLALIGPSGAGKSSFLRAGLLANKPPDWGHLICTPGPRPFTALGRALADELAGDTDAIKQLLEFEESDVALSVVSRWRQRHKHALVLVDQFEELFTLSPQPVQERFAGLLSRLALDADVHVLLSMRDDFLFRCHQFDTLAPIFSELTPLGLLSGGALRRALVQPALKCGYRFEDEALVDEMVAEVSEERGALPLVAFTAARLWEERDAERGLLTRAAYDEMGGVGGALAQHAEATLERIGSELIPVVREIFRNLVTAQGTRAARDREELLSVFGADRARYPTTARFPIGSQKPASGRPSAPADHALSSSAPKPQSAQPDSRPTYLTGTAGDGSLETAAQVLDTLIDARLLTSYEVPAAEGQEAGHHRIEIIHESLLSHWPRLVRWQTQDEEGAQLRDELRQASQVWEQHGRSDDLLWTGTAYEEFRLWRQRYPGGLSELEESFADAMVTHAERRKRRRRLAVAAALFLALAVTLTTSVLWRQSEASRRQAESEGRRAEAAKLLALAQLQLGTDPTEALAYATASLELADTFESRFFALRALFENPPARVLEVADINLRYPAFSLSGKWLAVAGHGREVHVYSEEGEGPILLPGHVESPRGPNRAWWSGNGYLVTGHGTEELRRVWSIPEGRLVRTIEFDGPTWKQIGESHLFGETEVSDAGGENKIFRLRAWPLPEGQPEGLGRVTWPAGATASIFDPSGRGWIYGKGDTIFYRPLPVDPAKPDLILGRHGAEVVRFGGFWRRPHGFWSLDSEGETRLWDTSGPLPRETKVFPRLETAPETALPDATGRRLSRLADQTVSLWDLDALPGARPLELRRKGSWYGALMDFHPSGGWVVASTKSDVPGHFTFWPLTTRPSIVVEGYRHVRRPVAFSSDGDWLATGWQREGPGDHLRLWPLPGTEEREVQRFELPTWAVNLAVDPKGRYVFVAGWQGRVFVVPLDGGDPRELEGFSEDTLLDSAAVSPSGNRVATAWSFGEGEREIRVWDLESDEMQILQPPAFPTRPEDAVAPQCIGAEGPERPKTDSSADVVGIGTLRFADESTLYSTGTHGILKWNLDTGTFERVRKSVHGGQPLLTVDNGSGTVLIAETRPGIDCECLQPSLGNLESGELRPLEGHGDCITWNGAADLVDGIVATGHRDGAIFVGRVGGSTPHLLVGHERPIQNVAISPDLRWIASSSDDDTLRLWPMPDLDKPPLHTLPLDELLAKLRSLTNLRAVEDPESSTGWSIEIGPFPGWKSVPTW